MRVVTDGGFIHLEGDTLRALLDDLAHAQSECKIHCLRIGADDGQAKWSIDHYIWTPPAGPVSDD